MTAAAHLERRQIRRTGHAVAGKDLHHAAERLGSVQAGRRSAHDLEVIDLLHRQLLPGSAAGGCRPDLDPVDEYQNVIRIRAADED